MLRILGRSAALDDADDRAMLASMRSFGPLTDPSRLGVKPDRVRVVPAGSTGSFETVVRGLGDQVLDVEGTSILNNLFPDQDVRKGQLVKIVIHS